MKPIAGLLLCVVSVGASSTNLRGNLVDANCFQSITTNVNRDYINVPAGRDLDLAIRSCYPRANKAKRFNVVLPSGEVLALDAAGDSQAVKLVNAAGKPKKGQDWFVVNVTGTISNHTVQVDSISGAN